ncbi:succinate dehydrogenase, cytochrome b556 subunit [Psychromonas sp. psych-6C06]|uniref:succinate dehydrogenase, cytochrome b556 subunit n=1 Tax=Psychromonas sp. psych-6C06 TaxID=2058089 RepID=UPI000C34EC3E|nr:succinate dehydrogenase, cytochrome b556 subunit [Psychromonas sp. psych-6C06]PKF60427.1 succinate dehydrogenase, cytochrome b556 subunit [Psychromonas sp. psych-6C06]
MRKERPKNLDLATVKFPITATASILHRVSGIIVFIALAIFLTLLNCSLSGPQDFMRVAGYFDNILIEFVMWGSLTGLAYHAVFGVRHMIQDLGFWEEMDSASLSAKVGFIVTAVLSVLAGILVW